MNLEVQVPVDVTAQCFTHAHPLQIHVLIANPKGEVSASFYELEAGLSGTLPGGQLSIAALCSIDLNYRTMARILQYLLPRETCTHPFLPHTSLQNLCSSIQRSTVQTLTS